MRKTNGYRLFVQQVYRQRIRAGENPNYVALFTDLDQDWRNLAEEQKENFKRKARRINEARRQLKSAEDELRKAYGIYIHDRYSQSNDTDFNILYDSLIDEWKNLPDLLRDVYLNRARRQN